MYPKKHRGSGCWEIKREALRKKRIFSILFARSIRPSFRARCDILSWSMGNIYQFLYKHLWGQNWGKCLTFAPVRPVKPTGSALHRFCENLGHCHTSICILSSCPMRRFCPRNIAQNSIGGEFKPSWFNDTRTFRVLDKMWPRPIVKTSDRYLFGITDVFKFKQNITSGMESVHF